MAVDTETQRFEVALDPLREILPYSYTQWVVESPSTWDYRVLVSRCPEGADCYDIAHRPGVIGQVFRRARPIFLSDARNHTLYDLYDPLVGWELAIPLLDGEKLAGVLNFEGGGKLALNDALWRRLGDFLSAETGLQLSGPVPLPGEAWMVRTTYVEITGATGLASDAALRLGRAVASGGLRPLVAGALQLPSSSNYLTVEQALTAGMPLGGCFRGGGDHVDLLEFGTHVDDRSEEPAWWSLAQGRYDFVLVLPTTQERKSTSWA